MELQLIRVLIWNLARLVIEMQALVGGLKSFLNLVEFLRVFGPSKGNIWKEKDEVKLKK